MNPVERGHILEYVKRVAGEKRTTFVLIEHDMDVVFGLSDRVVILNKGAKIAEGRPEEIRQNENVIEIYLGEEAA
jgi:branched-chain amino acid transport system ATP-binding protein